MTNKQITIKELKALQGKYNKLCSMPRSSLMKDYYIRLINSIDDIIEDIKEEE